MSNNTKHVAIRRTSDGRWAVVQVIETEYADGRVDRTYYAAGDSYAQFRDASHAASGAAEEWIADTEADALALAAHAETL